MAARLFVAKGPDIVVALAARNIRRKHLDEASYECCDQSRVSPIRPPAHTSWSRRSGEPALLPPPEWEPGNTRQTRDELLMEFVKKGEKIDNWTELLTMQQFRRARGPSSLREFYESAKQVREKRCPGLAEWTIVEEAEATLLYEWKMIGVCENQPPQSELVRLLLGRNTAYRVAYTTRSAWTPEIRTRWLEWLRGVSLIR